MTTSLPISRLLSGSSVSSRAWAWLLMASRRLPTPSAFLSSNQSVAGRSEASMRWSTCVSVRSSFAILVA
jgi:hypothetical protein